MPEISVIIPVYNSEQHLNECLDSVLNQSFQDFEIICIDDGSTDSSSDIIRRYQKEHPNIILLSQRNQYAGVARNAGIQRAKGKYITFLDSDDCFERNALETFYNKAESTGSDVVRSTGYDYDENGDRREVVWCLRKNGLSEDKTYCWRDIAQSLFCISSGNPWGTFVRRVLVMENNIRFLELPRTEDIYFTYDCYLKAKTISFVFDQLVFHRPSQNGMECTKVNYPLVPLEARHRLLAKVQAEGYYEETYLGFWFAAFHSYIQMIKSLLKTHSDEDYIREYYEEMKKVLKENPELNVDSGNPHADKLAEIYGDYRKIIDSADFEEYYSSEMQILEEREKLALFREQKIQGNFRKKDESDWERLEIAKRSHINSLDESILFSVVIPVYNAGKYLRECLDHLVNQSYTNIEIICVDDGSTDDSCEIIRSYPSVRLIKQDNSGAGIARNRGFRECHGEYVLFMDGDDWVEYSLFMNVFDHLRQMDSKPDMVMYSYTRFDEVTGEFKTYSNFDGDPDRTMMSNLDKDPGFFLSNNLVIPWNKVIRSEFIRNNGLEYPDFKCSNDRPFYFAALARAEEILVLNDVLINYRVNSKSVTSASRMEHFSCHFKTYQMVENDYHSRSTDISSRFVDTTISDMFHFYDVANKTYKDIIGKQICDYSESMYLDDIEEIQNYWWFRKLIQLKIRYGLYVSENDLNKILSVADRELLFQIGKLYADGVYPDGDHYKAIGTLMLSADKAYLPAKELLKTLFDESDPDAVLKVCGELSNRGNRSAQYRLGKYYRGDIGDRKNIPEAKRYFLMSAEQGMNASKVAWIELCYQGSDPIELGRASEMCRDLATGGNRDAQFRLAKMYQNGKGVTKDEAESIKWFTEAANNGHSGAKKELGYKHKPLNNIAKDNKPLIVKAFEDRILELSQQGTDESRQSVIDFCMGESDKGNAYASRYLARMYCSEHKENLSDNMYRRAMEINSSIVLYEYVKILYERGTDESLRECRSICEEHSKFGNKDALCRLGIMYLNGQGVPLDREKARELFVRAADAGSNIAAAELDKMRKGNVRNRLISIFRKSR